jgi:hypothetical protein
VKGRKMMTCINVESFTGVGSEGETSKSISGGILVGFADTHEGESILLGRLNVADGAGGTGLGDELATALWLDLCLDLGAHTHKGSVRHLARCTRGTPFLDPLATGLSGFYSLAHAHEVEAGRVNVADGASGTRRGDPFTAVLRLDRVHWTGGRECKGSNEEGKGELHDESVKKVKKFYMGNQCRAVQMFARQVRTCGICHDALSE